MLLPPRFAEESGQHVHLDGRDLLRAFSEGKKKNVDIAQRTGETPDPREFSREMIDHTLRKNLSDLTEKRSCAADGYPKVVKELGVEACAQTRLVQDEELVQAKMNLPSPDLCRNRPIEIRQRRRDMRSCRSTDLTQYHVIGMFRRGLDAGPTLNHWHESLVDVFVSAQARQRDEDRQRPPGAAHPRLTRAAGLDPQARHNLASIVQHLEERSVPLCVRLCEQPSHTDHG